MFDLAQGSLEQVVEKSGELHIPPCIWCYLAIGSGSVPLKQDPLRYPVILGAIHTYQDVINGQFRQE